VIEVVETASLPESVSHLMYISEKSVAGVHD
jgi:hypothetical protein